jgi:hypothetical protein
MTGLIKRLFCMMKQTLSEDTVCIQNDIDASSYVTFAARLLD